MLLIVNFPNSYLLMWTHTVYNMHQQPSSDILSIPSLIHQWITCLHYSSLHMEALSHDILFCQWFDGLSLFFFIIWCSLLNVEWHPHHSLLGVGCNIFSHVVTTKWDSCNHELALFTANNYNISTNSLHDTDK